MSHVDCCNFLIVKPGRSQPGFTNAARESSFRLFFSQILALLFTRGLVSNQFGRDRRQQPGGEFQRRRSPLRDLLVDIAERGRSMGVLLLGAEQYAGSVEEENGAYTASVPNVSGATATGATLMEAENNLTIRIDELV